MDKPQHLPDIDRLSILAATILLAYALARVINLPIQIVELRLLGFYLAIQINVRTFAVLLVAVLTATGADWLLRDHPTLTNKKTFEHWLLPALTAWVIGIPLFTLPLGPSWWTGFAGGGLILMLVLVAEYIVVDHQDMRQPPAAAGLTIVSFALYLFLTISLKSAGIRLVLILPALAFAGGLVCLRVLHLRLHGEWAFLQAFVIVAILLQFIAALYYWHLSAVSFGLLLIGLTYALNSFIAGLAEGDTLRQAILEPGIVLIFLWGFAAWFH